MKVPSVEILVGDCRDVLKTLPDESVNCIVTSPPYFGLRDYGVDGQIGLERSWPDFVAALVGVFLEARRVLRSDGTLWLNLGDSYATGAGSVGNCPGGGEQGDRWKGNRGDRPGLPKHSNGAMGPMTQANRLPQPGLKPKDLMGMPWRVAFALQADGWYLRSDIIWHKPNPMPESVTDRCTKAHEYIFLFTKSERYFYDHEAIKEPAICGHNGSSFVSPHDVATKPNLGMKPRPSQARGSFNGKTEAMADSGQNAFRAVVETRNKRSVWSVSSQPYSDAHFATYPPDLIKPCILAGCPIGGTVLDPFGGSGTTGQVALELGRSAILIELNPAYAELCRQRTAVTPGLGL